MRKIFDTTIEMQVRLFYVLAWTASIANTLGFLSNWIFYGLTLETCFCGVCAIVIYIAAIWGVRRGRIEAAKKIILFVINALEFPFLYYIYGPGRIIYMALGIIGILMFLEKKKRQVISFIMLIYDAAIMVVSVLYPSNRIIYSQIDDLGASVASFAIVIVSIALIVLILLQQYEKQNEDAQKLAKKLAEMANIDPLTNLYNRRFLTEYLDKRMTQINAEFTVALLDLDNFKSVNDRYGHIYGDQVLITFADSMQKHIKNHGIAARYGGEEFMLVFNNTDKDQIIQILDEIQKDIIDFSKQSKDFVLTYSGGVKIYCNEDRIIHLFNSVDESLYAAKKAGKNRVVFCE